MPSTTSATRERLNFTVRFFHNGKCLGQSRGRLGTLARQELSEDGKTVVGYTLDDHDVLRTTLAKFLENKYRDEYAENKGEFTRLIVDDDGMASPATTPNVTVYQVDGNEEYFIGSDDGDLISIIENGIASSEIVTFKLETAGELFTAVSKFIPTEKSDLFTQDQDRDGSLVATMHLLQAQNADVIGRLTAIEQQQQQQQQQQATPLAINNTDTGTVTVFSGSVSGGVTIQNVNYHGDVQMYQNGGDVAITTNAINGGGGPPNGPFVAGGAAGPGTAAGIETGAGTDPPLLGGGEAGVSTPTSHATDDLESIIESTVTKAVDRILQRVGLNEGGDLPSIMKCQLQRLETILDRIEEALKIWGKIGSKTD